MKEWFIIQGVAHKFLQGGIYSVCKSKNAGGLFALFYSKQNILDHNQVVSERLKYKFCETCSE